MAKKAISSSVDQIYGAERFLKGVQTVILKDKITEVKLPEISKREIFRIAVAFGKEDHYPLNNGNLEMVLFMSLTRNLLLLF